MLDQSMGLFNDITILGVSKGSQYGLNEKFKLIKCFKLGTMKSKLIFHIQLFPDRSFDQPNSIYVIVTNSLSMYVRVK